MHLFKTSHILFLSVVTIYLFGMNQLPHDGAIMPTIDAQLARLENTFDKINKLQSQVKKKNITADINQELIKLANAINPSIQEQKTEIPIETAINTITKNAQNIKNDPHATPIQITKVRTFCIELKKYENHIQDNKQGNQNIFSFHKLKNIEKTISREVSQSISQELKNRKTKLLLDSSTYENFPDDRSLACLFHLIPELELTNSNTRYNIRNTIESIIDRSVMSDIPSPNLNKEILDSTLADQIQKAKNEIIEVIPQIKTALDSPTNEDDILKLKNELENLAQSQRSDATIKLNIDKLKREEAFYLTLSFSGAKENLELFIKRVFSNIDNPSILNDKRIAFLLPNKNRFESLADYEKFVQTVQSLVADLLNESSTHQPPKIIVTEDNIERIKNEISTYEDEFKALEISFSLENINEFQKKIDQTIVSLISYMPPEQINNNFDLFGALYSIFLKYKNIQKMIERVNQIRNDLSQKSLSADEAQQKLETIKNNNLNDPITQKLVSVPIEEIKHNPRAIKEHLIKTFNLTEEKIPTADRSQLLAADYQEVRKNIYKYSAFMGYLKDQSNPKLNTIPRYPVSQWKLLIDEFYPENNDKSPQSDRSRLLQALEDARPYINPTTPEERREWLETPLRSQQLEKELQKKKKTKLMAQSPAKNLSTNNNKASVNYFRQAALSLWQNLSSWWKTAQPEQQEKTKTSYEGFH